jgi:Ca2+-transporting ATPase
MKKIRVDSTLFRSKETPIINRSLIIRVLVAAAFIIAGTLMIYISEMRDGEVTAKDTTMTFTTFVFFDMFNALSSRSETKSIFRIGFTSNRPFLFAVTASILCQFFVIYVPFFQSIFQTESLEFWEIIKIVLLSSTVWIADELRKFYIGSWRQRRKYHSLASKYNRV